MRDFLGQELSVGDEVVYIRGHYRELIKGKISRITKCFIFIGDTKREPRTVIKITGKNAFEGVAEETRNGDIRFSTDGISVTCYKESFTQFCLEEGKQYKAIILECDEDTED